MARLGIYLESGSAASLETRGVVVEGNSMPTAAFQHLGIFPTTVEEWHRAERDTGLFLANAALDPG